MDVLDRPDFAGSKRKYPLKRPTNDLALIFQEKWRFDGIVVFDHPLSLRRVA
jgi:hypothetical protein